MSFCSWVCSKHPKLAKYFGCKCIEPPPPPPPPPPPQPPIVTLSVVPIEGQAPLSIFAAVSMTDPNGGLTGTFEIDFGDGTIVAAAYAGHTYNSEGAFTVTGKGTNEAGLSDTDEKTVSVSAPPPPTRTVVLGASSGPQTKLISPPLADHQYGDWNGDLFNPADEKNFLRLDTVFYDITFGSRSEGWTRGTPTIVPAEIVAGKRDAEVDYKGLMLASVTRPLFVSLHHEWRGTKECSGDTLKAATAYVIARWKALGATQHIYCACPLNQVFKAGRQDGEVAWDSIDALGVDGYGQNDVAAGKVWLDAPAVFDEALAAARAHSKPLVIFETSFHDATAAMETPYMTSLDAYLRDNEDIRGCCFYLAGNDALTPDGLALLQSWAADPFYSRTL